MPFPLQLRPRPRFHTVDKHVLVPQLCQLGILIDASHGQSASLLSATYKMGGFSEINFKPQRQEESDMPTRWLFGQGDSEHYLDRL